MRILAGVAVALLSIQLGTASVILTYHDFVRKRDSHSLWFDCTPSEFELQIRWLKRHGVHFVSLVTIVDAYQNHHRLNPKTISLTFADGYEGFFRYAVPVLRRERIPATMFVHTGFVGNQQGRPKMNWSQLLELDREGLVRIESQTVNHPLDLRLLSDQDLQSEVQESRRMLEMKLRRQVNYLAYPNGKFDERAEEQVERAGYSAAFSEVTKPVEESPNRWSINRYVHTKWRQAYRDEVSRTFRRR